MAHKRNIAARVALGVIAAPVAIVALLATAGVALGFLGPLKHDLDAFANLRPQLSLIALVSSAFLAALGSRRLALLTLGAGAVGLVGLGPAWRAPQALPADCPKTVFRVVVANVDAYSATPDERDAALANLAKLNADLIAAVEMSPAYHRAAIKALGALPHHASAAHRPGVFSGAALYSKRPLTPLGPAFKPKDAPGYAAATVRIAGRSVGVLALHLARPVIGPQARQINALPALLKGLPRERVLLGDFNASSWGHALSEVGRLAGVRPIPGFRRTWRGVYPNPLADKAIPAIYGAQIDHVLIPAGVGARWVDVVDLPGSVHWGVVADLEFSTRRQGCAAKNADTSTKR